MIDVEVIVVRTRPVRFEAVGSCPACGRKFVRYDVNTLQAEAALRDTLYFHACVCPERED